MVLDMVSRSKILDVEGVRQAYEAVDVEIKVGLRKGEKLDEALFGGTEAGYLVRRTGIFPGRVLRR